MSSNIIWFESIGMNDVARVGGKNASLGEMMTHLGQAGIAVPRGFATTATAYQTFLTENQLTDRIKQALATLNVDDVDALRKTGATIRQWILDAPFPKSLEQDLRAAYQTLEQQTPDLRVAVRSSATAEDLPEASFAGQQETFLNMQSIEQVITATKHVFASLFNDRAISYRSHHHFNHMDVALSAGIQHMVRSDEGASGVMFSIDTESGFDKVVFITASYGLGEPIVQGQVNPDEFYVYKPNLEKNKPAILKKSVGSKRIKMIFNHDASALHQTVKTIPVEETQQQQFSLSDDDITQLARYAVAIEKHYGRPMDIEWGKDGITKKLYILQARPETVKSRASTQHTERFQLKNKGDVLASGRSIGQKVGQGTAKIIMDLADMQGFSKGDVLVTDMTDPDWEPIMKRAAAIVTNRGGRTCHAAIIARELGIPAVVGCGDATQHITTGQSITVSCAEGDTGYIYNGLSEVTIVKTELNSMPEIPFKIMMNVGNPERAFDFQALPNAGVGLARIEFVINQTVGIHPNALLNLEQLNPALKQQIQQRIAAYASPTEYYIERLKEGIAMIAAAFYPKPVIVRLSDFKSNEYANLLGGDLYEPREENPMLGFRGASRYAAPAFQQCFELECRAVKRVREDMGFTNVEVMIPFVRTVSEASAVIDVLTQYGLKRGEHGLRLIMMCEIPSNALLAEKFLTYFDGFSIGSNDLTQLTLGVDRDSAIVAGSFDERDPAVKALLQMAIQTCKRNNKYIGICGQGPSDHPDLAQWLIEEGIDSISLNPDTVVATWLLLANAHAVEKQKTATG